MSANPSLVIKSFIISRDKAVINPDLLTEMTEICALASGSNGNCYYIGNSTEAILIDAGIPARRILSRMQERNIDPGMIKAIFISHEHADHVCGARVLSKRLKVPVYITSRTFSALYGTHRPASPVFFKPGDIIGKGAFLIHPFLKNHDAAEPCSFRVEHEGHNIGVLTDIGSPCANVQFHLGKCDALFLETNYDDKMLWEGSYPWYLKKRIASDNGHLSNVQALELIRSHGSDKLNVIFLSHLSAENNTPSLASGCFSDIGGRINIHLTSRHGPCEVYRFPENIAVNLSKGVVVQGKLDFGI